MVNEAALRAVRLGRSEVLQEDLMEAVETVVAGKEKKDRLLNPMEKRMVAFHEIGHALVSALGKQRRAAAESSLAGLPAGPLAAPMPPAPPVQKITIIPRTMGSLGYTMQAPEEDRYLMTKSELLAQITTLLAGRAAEEVEFGEASTGASNDIERATKLARNMVTQYGMSEKFGMMGLESPQNQYLDGRNVFTASDISGAGVDEEISRIINRCHEEAAALLLANREKLSELAEYLTAHETISGAQFMERLKPELTA
jgi:cell division protease FtsH